MKKWITLLLLTPIISLILWIFGVHHLLNFINSLFYVSIILFIIIFIVLLVQEGIFDATSYGMRRLKFHMSSRKKQTSMADDSFFNPKHAKKEHYMIGSWVLPGLIINICYVILSLILSLILY